MVMEAKESVERIDLGLSRAASCCRELAKMLDASEWKHLSRELLKMREKALRFYKEPPLTEPQIINLVTQMEIAQKNARMMNG